MVAERSHKKENTRGANEREFKCPAPRAMLQDFRFGIEKNNNTVKKMKREPT